VGRIKALPEALQSQIAAGEVVERPASVVKELVENSLDAGAGSVRIEVEGGGLTRLAVTDDGQGMDRDDAVASLGRHATSKLSTVEDLSNLRSYGFRGEALPSIASVSRLTITTRTADAAEGVRVLVEGGGDVLVEPAGTTTGTRVDVRDLFFNVPARRKFQKSERAEATAIEETVTRMALAAPAVDVQLVIEGREVLRAPPAKDAIAEKDRAERVLGKNARGHLYPVDGGLGPFAIHGFLANPAFSRGDQRGIYTYVNGRFIKDRSLTHAVIESFRTLLEVGRYPVAIVMLTLPPDMVDVNVHPQKLEVRFLDSPAMHHAVTQTLIPVLRRTPWLRTESRSYTLKEVPSSAVASGAPSASSFTSDVAQLHRDRAREAMDRYAQRAQDVPPPDRTFFNTPVKGPVTLPGLGGALNFARLKPMGQVGLTYLVCEGPEGLVVVDQHAAHERVNFERLRRGAREGQVKSQQLLVPLRVTLTAAEEEALQRQGDVLTRAGFELSSLGPGDVLLRAVPTVLQGKQPERLCKELLAELGDTGSRAPLDDALDAIFARVACHASVRAGDPMGLQEIRALLESLDGIDLGAHCPHGRPVVRSLPVETMASWFDRT